MSLYLLFDVCLIEVGSNLMQGKSTTFILWLPPSLPVGVNWWGQQGESMFNVCSVILFQVLSWTLTLLTLKS